MVTIVDELLDAANRVANEEADLLNRAADRICAQWQKLDDADKVIDTLRRQVDEWADKCAKAEAQLAREVRVERTTDEALAWEDHGEPWILKRRQRSHDPRGQTLDDSPGGTTQ